MGDLPTPEHQEATARRYLGQRALVTPEPVEEATYQPPAPQQTADEPRRSLRKAFWHWARLVTLWTLIGLLVVAFGAHQVNGPNFNTTFTTVPAYPAIYPSAHSATIVLAVALGVLAAFWFLVGMGYYLVLVWKTTGEAMKPVPSLAEIDQQLRAEGYVPSIADCVALHQYLTSQRNEAAFFAGALVIGPQLLAQQARGKPIL
jgi:hypothetical protein